MYSMGLNFLQVSAHSWAENTFTDRRNRNPEYLDLSRKGGKHFECHIINMLNVSNNCST